MMNPASQSGAQSGPEGYGPGDPGADGQRGGGLFRILHRRLRGRYILAFVLLFFGAAGGGILGYRSTVPVYQSVGIIEIKPTVDPLLYDSEQGSVMPMFGAYVKAQVALLQNRRVIDAAMAKDEWRSLGKGISDQEVVEFIKNLAVKYVTGEQTIAIIFTDPDPNVCRIAVNCVMGAYQGIFTERDREHGLEKKKALDESRAKRERRLEELGGELSRLTIERGGVTGFDTAFKNCLEDKRLLEQRKVALENELTLAKRARPVVGDPMKLTVQQIGLLDMTMAGYLAERGALEDEIELESKEYGPNHSKMMRLARALEILNERIEEYAEACRELRKSGSVKDDGVAELEFQLGQVEERLVSSRQRLKDLSQTQIQVENTRTEMETARQQLEEVRLAIERHRSENPVGGRISLTPADRPVAPAKDKRLQMAVLGAMLGGGLGVLLVLLLGGRNLRLRDLRDAEDGLRSLNVLGVFPLLTGVTDDPQDDQTTGLCVHHIRTFLQLGAASDGVQMVGVTSADPAAGKSTLALALGISYSEAGCRTLLVDCDLSGRGLTVQSEALMEPVGAGRGAARSGEVASEGNVGGRSLAATLEIARRGRERGSAGSFAPDPAGVQQGLWDAVHGADPTICIRQLGLPRLDILPRCGGDRSAPGQLSPAALGGLLRRLRAEYDVLIVDTGPVNGSIEAPIVASLVDRVVLAVSRGEERGRVEEALRKLDAVGANVAGMVFNRAEMSDARRQSVSSSSSSAAYAESEPESGAR